MLPNHQLDPNQKMLVTADQMEYDTQAETVAAVDEVFSDVDASAAEVVETAEALFTYEIVSAPRDLTVQEDDSWVLFPLPGQEGVRPGRPIITLTTHQDFVPSPDRSVGFGVLTQMEIKK